MKEERMSILKMLDEGKITADEAVKLIDAVNSGAAAKANDMFSSVKDSVTKFAKDAEPVVKSAATKVAEKSIIIGGNVKKKLEEKINESKYKDKVYKFKGKADDIIDDISDDIQDIFEVNGDDDNKKSEAADNNEPEKTATADTENTATDENN